MASCTCTMRFGGDGQAGLGQHGLGVGEQPLLVRLVAPRPGHHLAPLPGLFLLLRILRHERLLSASVPGTRAGR